MPISRPDAIPIVGEIIWGKNPRSILDIGVGFGTWGVLFRAWTDIRMSEVSPSRFHQWRTTIMGIEIHPDYVNKCWEVYDAVMIGDATDLLMSSSALYDHIHLGDVIEHLGKEEGKRLLELCKSRLNPGGTITVVTPDGFRPQGAVLGNVHETHKCGWTVVDFEKLGATHVWRTRANKLIVAAFQS